VVFSIHKTSTEIKIKEGREKREFNEENLGENREGGRSDHYGRSQVFISVTTKIGSAGM
jgi:hypothetical protein